MRRHSLDIGVATNGSQATTLPAFASAWTRAFCYRDAGTNRWSRARTGRETTFRRSAVAAVEDTPRLRRNQAARIEPHARLNGTSGLDGRIGPWRLLALFWGGFLAVMGLDRNRPYRPGLLVLDSALGVLDSDNHERFPRDQSATPTLLQFVSGREDPRWIRFSLPSSLPRDRSRPSCPDGHTRVRGFKPRSPERAKTTRNSNGSE